MDQDNRSWHYAENGQQLGPVPAVQLKSMVESGSLPPTALVWCEGMSTWEPYQKVFAAGVSLPSSAPRPDTGTELVIDHPEALPVSNEELSPTFCIGLGWDLTIKKFGMLIGYGALYMVLAFAVSIVFSVTGAALQYLVTEGMGLDEWAAVVVSLLNSLVNQAASVFFALGLIRVAMNIIGGEYVTPGTLFSQGKNFLSGVGAYFLYMLMVVVGLLFLIVPGIYLALRFGQYKNAIVDRNLGPIEALSYSSRLTEGNIMNLFGLAVLNFLITVAGALCLFIGLLWAIPCVTLAQVFAYRCLQGGQGLIGDLEQRRNNPAPLVAGTAAG